MQAALVSNSHGFSPFPADRFYIWTTSTCSFPSRVATADEEKKDGKELPHEAATNCVAWNVQKCHNLAWRRHL
jgi:hypothetical protein